MATAKEQIETVVAEPKPAALKAGAARDAAVIASDEWGPEAPPDRREFVRFTHLHRALHACMIDPNLFGAEVRRPQISTRRSSQNDGLK